MSSAIRKLQREVIRNRCYHENGNKQSFKDEWDKFHYGKTEEVDDDGKVVAVKSKRAKKQNKSHADNGRVFVRQLKAMKAFADSMKNKVQNTNAKEKVC